MSQATRKGLAPHPAKGVIAMRRLTVRRVAAILGMSEQVVGRMLNGVERASPRLRAGLSALLNTAESELFRAER